MRKLTFIQKLSLPLLVNLLIVLSLFSLKFLGVQLAVISIAIGAVISLEIIYLAVFIQMSVNKNNQILSEIAKQITEMQEGEERSHAVLSYSRHQMKALQQEIDILRKGTYYKNGNGHHTKARA